MCAETLREHGSDPPDLLQRLEGPERDARLTILDDPCRERRSDPGQPVQLLRCGNVDVDRTDRDGG
jgi:hypothetical protein